MKIAFIGLGIMGSAMVKNLLKKGYAVQGWARHPEKVQFLVQNGMALKDSVATTVSDADIVFTMVGGPADVEELYFGQNGIINHVNKGAVLIDCTSSSPKVATRIFKAAQERGCEALDVPVSGGQKGAEDGTLSLFVGGKREVLAKVKTVLEAISGTITYEGPAGFGQHTKLVNQIMVAGQLAGMCEGFAYALEKGLDLEAVLKSVSPGAARCASLDLYGEKILKGDKKPGGALRYLVKDLKNAYAELEGSGLDLAASKAAMRCYAQMEAEGHGNDGTQALTWFYDEHRSKIN